MNTEKVFIGYSKDNKELLLYRVDKNTYIDLLNKNNNIYPIDNIDLSTLIPAPKSIKLNKHMLKYFIIKKYKKDRELLLDINNIFYGKIYVINNLKLKEKYA